MGRITEKEQYESMKTKRRTLTLGSWINEERDRLASFEQKWEADHRDMDEAVEFTPEQWAKAYKEWRDDPRRY